MSQLTQENFEVLADTLAYSVSRQILAFAGMCKRSNKRFDYEKFIDRFMVKLTDRIAEFARFRAMQRKRFEAQIESAARARSIKGFPTPKNIDDLEKPAYRKDAEQEGAWNRPASWYAG